MTPMHGLEDLASRLEADPGDSATYAAIDVLARTLSALLTAPGVDDDLFLSGAALQLSMAREELRSVGLAEETTGSSNDADLDHARLLAEVRRLLHVVLERLGSERSADLPGDVVLARARVRLCVGTALEELDGGQ
ncbi:MAG: hypothetical protein ACRDOY_05940 [Nocardioidaceae bacterium]